jgi:hypothetical protein
MISRRQFLISVPLTVEEENLGKSVDPHTVESVLETDRRAIHKFFGV